LRHCSKLSGVVEPEEVGGLTDWEQRVGDARGAS